MEIIPASLLVCCLLTTHAFATDNPSSVRVKAATELLHVLNSRKAAMAGAGAIINAMIQANPMMGPYRGFMMQWAAKYLTWKQMGPKLARLYAGAFSTAQLDDLIRFYKTPTGQKAVRELSKLAAQAALVGGQICRRHIPELRQMIRVRAAQLQKASP